jgi:hypothetical protein
MGRLLDFPETGYAGDSRESKMLCEPHAAAIASISIMKSGSQNIYFALNRCAVGSAVVLIADLVSR